MVDLNRLILKINKYLLEKITEEGFVGRSFYGESFFAAALGLYDESTYSDTIVKLVKAADKKNDAENSTRHWEFNNYALLYLIKKYPKYSDYLKHDLVYGKTKSTNWILLRTLCILYEKKEGALKLCKNTLEKCQLENGLILDAENVSSFQYHCFSTTLLYEIYQETNDIKVQKSFIKAVEFISKFTLRDGETLYVGRGQEQIFGYGSLVYLYEAAYEATRNKEYLLLREKVAEYLGKYVIDMQVPLVLREGEENHEATLDINDKKHMGWYSYNNYFDYVPFLLFFLVKTQILQSVRRRLANEEVNKKENEFYYDQYFLRFSTNDYDAVVACYPGANANYQLLPYIVSDKGNVTPCFGGETSWSCDLYKDISIPAPYFEFTSAVLPYFYSKKFLYNTLKRLKNRLMPKKIFCLWENDEFEIRKIDKNKFVVECDNKLMQFSRAIIFQPQKVEIKDVLIFKKKVRFNKIGTLNISTYGCAEIGKNMWELGKGWFVELKNRGKIVIKVISDSCCAKGEIVQLRNELQMVKMKKNDELCWEYTYFIK